MSKFVAKEAKRTQRVNVNGVPTLMVEWAGGLNHELL